MSSASASGTQTACAEMNDTVSVVMSTDARYAMQLAVAIASIETTGRTSSYAVHVLHDGIPVEVQRRVKASANDRVTIEWCEIDRGSLTAATTDSRLPLTTLYRLLMTDALPEDLQRVIYLDCDLIVRRDLEALWRTPLDGSPCAAVRDARIAFLGSPDGPPWRPLGLDPHAPYFNAGVLVVDLDRWRDEDLGARALDALSAHAIVQNDQGALNTVLSGRWTRLAPAWNVQGSHFIERNNMAWAVEPTDELEAAYADPAIVHFSGLSKPWNPRCVHPHRDAWFAALEQTDWAGWTPPRAIVRRTVGRARRAIETAFGR